MQHYSDYLSLSIFILYILTIGYGNLRILQWNSNIHFISSQIYGSYRCAVILTVVDSSPFL